MSAAGARPRSARVLPTAAEANALPTVAGLCGPDWPGALPVGSARGEFEGVEIGVCAADAASMSMGIERLMRNLVLVVGDGRGWFLGYRWVVVGVTGSARSSSRSPCPSVSGIRCEGIK